MKTTIFSKIFSRSPETRFLFFLISDIFLIAIALYGSFFVRFDFTLPDQYLPVLPYYLLISLLIILPIFYLKRLYHFTWVYVSIDTLLELTKSLAYAFLVFGLLLFIGRETMLAKSLPRSIILIDFVLLFVFLGTLRFSKRLYTELIKKEKASGDKQKLVIIGAGDSTEQLVRTINRTEDYPFKIAGILDDSDFKQKTSLYGTPILGRVQDLPRLKQIKKIYGIIIALKDAPVGEINKIVALAHECGIQYIKTLPTLVQVMERGVSLSDVRDISVEDLLGRKKIDIDYNEIKSLIQNKKVLITGAAGSIGKELVKQVHSLSPQKLVALDMDETGIFKVEQFLNEEGHATYVTYIANILNKQRLTQIFDREKPDIVFHAAAYKHVKLMEEHPGEAVMNNILGTWNTVECAKQSGVNKFIFISTDKAVNPTSIMGMSKRVAEMLIMHYNSEKMACSAVRFGNVLGSRGSVVPIFKKQIRSGGPVTVTHKDMQRYFMVPSEAILLVLQSAYLGKGGELFVLDMGEPVKIIDLARTMIQLAGLEPEKDIPIVITKPVPGEKLNEEILSDKENMDATKNKKIFIAPNDSGSDKDAFFTHLENLIMNAKQGDPQTTSLLKNLIH